MRGEITAYFINKLFGWDTTGILPLIIYLGLIAAGLAGIILNQRVTFKCPHCSNTFQKVIFGGQRRYVRRYGKDSEKYLRCPFCKNENLCRYIPTEEEEI